MSGGCGLELEPLTCPVLPTRVFGSQNLTTVKLKGVGESFQKYPDYESKGIKAHFNLDESGVLSLDRVSGEAWAASLSRAVPRDDGTRGTERPWGRVILGSQ